MTTRISRRTLARFYTEALISGQRKSLLTNKLAAYVIESGRQSEVGLIAKDIEFALSSRGVVVADVVSAQPLSDSTMSAITSLASSQLGARQVEVRSVIDPSVVGGVKIDMAGLRFDGTVRQKLRRLQITQTN